LTESDPAPAHNDVFLRLDLGVPGNQKLADYGARILNLLQCLETQQNHFLLATLDDFLGVLYALIFAKCNDRAFKDRNGPIEVKTVVKRAEHVAEGKVRTSGNWLTGFHFNSALFRIAATYHRGLKVVCGKGTSDLQKGELLTIVEPTFPSWQHKELDKIHKEVNQLKHDGEGLFQTRTVTWKEAESAVEELLELFEIWRNTNANPQGNHMALVFQYGSNCLDSEINGKNRLCGDARFVDIAETVEDFELTFDVQSIGRGCAASDIVRKPGGKVWGVLYEVPDFLIDRKTAKERGRKSFDEIEGEGTNYKRETIKVCRANGKIVSALTYTVKCPKAGLRTTTDYVRLIVHGLREHKISDEYVAKVKAIAAANNPGIGPAVEKL